MKTKIILVMLVIASIAGVTYAQTTKPKAEIRKSCYVDSNKNKICDKYEKKSCKIGNGTGTENCTVKTSSDRRRGK